MEKYSKAGDTNIASHEYRDYPMEEMMKKLKPLMRKQKLIAEKESTPEKKRGVGILGEASMFPTSLFDQCGVALELNEDNTVTKYDTWQDLGQGADVGSLMVTLEALKPLGLTPDQVASGAERHRDMP